jgi:hypothetical protein
MDINICILFKIRNRTFTLNFVETYVRLACLSVSRALLTNVINNATGQLRHCLFEDFSHFPLMAAFPSMFNVRTSQITLFTSSIRLNSGLPTLLRSPVYVTSILFGISFSSVSLPTKCFKPYCS